MVAFWSGSYARKSQLLAKVGKVRSPKKGRRRKGERGPFWKRKKHAANRAAKNERKNWQEAYANRNRILADIGFVCYSNYLVSDLWKSIREKVLRRDRFQCFGCGHHAFQVHHRSYDVEVLKGININPLVAICRDCHETIEVDNAGRKLSLEAANRRLDAIRSRNRRASK